MTFAGRSCRCSTQTSVWLIISVGACILAGRMFALGWLKFETEGVKQWHRHLLLRHVQMPFRSWARKPSVSAAGRQIALQLMALRQHLLLPDLHLLLLPLLAALLHRLGSTAATEVEVAVTEAAAVAVTAGETADTITAGNAVGTTEEAMTDGTTGAATATATTGTGTGTTAGGSGLGRDPGSGTKAYSCGPWVRICRSCCSG